MSHSKQTIDLAREIFLRSINPNEDFVYQSAEQLEYCGEKFAENCLVLAAAFEKRLNRDVSVATQLVADKRY